jgi:rSAM/selenodomain-associated transferase 1
MVDVSGARVLAILTRAPSAGGKTRLFDALGRTPDPALLEALLRDTLEGADVPGLTRVVAVEPAELCDEVARIVGDRAAVIPQPHGTLGERMRATMAQMVAAGAAAVALIGSDLPEIDSAAVSDAFALLEAEPLSLVLGPTIDGGYYLIAATAVPDVFDGIEWGTPRVLRQTVNAAAATLLPVRFIAPLADVDTVADLRRVAASLAGPGRARAWARARGLG